MYCSACKKEYPADNAYCPSCGAALVPFARVRLSLTREELASGGRKTIFFPGMDHPLSLSLIPGLRAGQTLRVRNACFLTAAGVKQGEVHVLLEEAETDKPVSPAHKKKTAKKKKKTPFGVRLASFVSVFPLAVVLTVGLFYFTARPVFDAAGLPAVLLLCGIALLLLLFLRLAVPKRYVTAPRKSLVFVSALALALALRYGPPKLGIDLTETFARLGASLFPHYVTVTVTEEPAATPATLPAPTPEPAPTVSPVPDSSAADPYLALLDKNAKENFDALYAALKSWKKDCTLPHRATEEEVSLLMLLLRLECPELLMADFSAPYYTVSGYNGVRSVEFTYSLSKTEYEAEMRVLDAVLSRLYSRAASLGTYDRILLAYETVTKNTTYSLSAPHAATAYGALSDGAAKCDGVSLAMKWLLDGLGVPSLVMTGTARDDGAGHAWNLVLLDGQYYALDATADLGTGSDGLLYPAFLIPESVMEEIYVPDGQLAAASGLVTGQGYEKSYHAVNGSFASSYEEANDLLSRGVRALRKTNGGTFLIACGNAADFERLSGGLDNAVRSLLNKLGRGGKYTAVTLAAFNTMRISILFAD